jgi:hypothetical protein
VGRRGAKQNHPLGKVAGIRSVPATFPNGWFCLELPYPDIETHHAVIARSKEARV